MRTLIIIRKRGAGYVIDVAVPYGGSYAGRQCGLSPYEAATTATRAMANLADLNPEGGDLMAPPEVIAFVPEAWRNVPAKS